jgi:hypothetical protein
MYAIYKYYTEEGVKSLHNICGYKEAIEFKECNNGYMYEDGRVKFIYVVEPLRGIAND